MAVFKEVRPFRWPIEHICISGNSAGSSGSSEALRLAVRRTIALYGVSFVLECDEIGVLPESWKSLLEFLGIESEGLLHLARVRRPQVGPRVKLRSWSGWRSRVDRAVETLTVGAQSEHPTTLSLKLAEKSSFGALVIFSGDSQLILEGMVNRNWNIAVSESVPNKSKTELLRDWDSVMDGLALPGLGFLCVVGDKGDGTFSLDFHLWTESGFTALSRVHVGSEPYVREEVLRVQKRLERGALAALATSTFTSTFN